MDTSLLVLAGLADSSVRILCLAAMALSAMWLARVRSVSIRHAVWTLTLGAMLLLPWMTAVLPDLPVRILPSQRGVSEGARASSSIRFISGGVIASGGGQEKHTLPTWQQLGLAVYGLGLAAMLARLLIGCVLVRRLLRSSEPVSDPRTAVLTERHGGGSPPVLLESPRASVPMTTGTLAPRVILPSGWRAWGNGKLEASLMHELAHVRRRDPLIARVAAFNTCVFWFHPLAWWLERKIALLAEQAADDSTLLAMGDRSGYASALLDMTSAAGAGRRLSWEAVSMAGASQLRQRIDRVLDESVRLSAGVNKWRWLALSLGGTVLLCGVAAVRLEAQAAPQASARQEAEQRLREELRSPYARWLDEDVVYIISDAERSAFLQLYGEKPQQAFIEEFWQKRDPTPDTVENEFKEEHYRRIAYANQRFASGIPGWKMDRGRVYIVYGPPDEIEAHPAGDQNSPPYEIWRYRWIENFGEDVRLMFYDPARNGEYRLLWPDLAAGGDPYFRPVPAVAGSPSLPAGSWFASSVSVVGRSSPGTTSSLVQLDVVLDREQLRFQRLGSGERAVVLFHGRVTTAGGIPVKVFEDVLTVDVPVGVPMTGQSYYRKRVPLDPGDYTLHLEAKETASGRTESQELGFAVPAVR